MPQQSPCWAATASPVVRWSLAFLKWTHCTHRKMMHQLASRASVMVPRRQCCASLGHSSEKSVFSQTSALCDGWTSACFFNACWTRSLLGDGEQAPQVVRKKGDERGLTATAQVQPVSHHTHDAWNLEAERKHSKSVRTRKIWIPSHKYLSIQHGQIRNLKNYGDSSPWDKRTILHSPVDSCCSLFGHLLPER